MTSSICGIAARNQIGITKQSGRWLSGSVRLGLWLLVAGCPVPAQALTQDELDASRNLWNINDLKDYDYVLQRQCFCIEELRRPGLVQVRTGAIAAVTDIETLQPLNPEFFRTVEGLFDELQNAIDVSADDIQAEFDSTFSHPTSIWIDFDRRIADEELVYSAHDFRVIDKPGDINRNGVLDTDDLDVLTNAIATGSTDIQFDIDQSGVVDLRDRFHWVKDLKQTWFGDANLDGEFNSGDLVDVFVAGKYVVDLNLAETATWGEGDWNGDMLFDSGDLVLAFEDSGYVTGAATAVPEPTSVVVVIGGLIGLAVRRRLAHRTHVDE